MHQQRLPIVLLVMNAVDVHIFLKNYKLLENEN